jgi:citrate synthase
MEKKMNIQDEFLQKYSKIAAADKIPQDKYNQYNVKRGLRNPDGSGVLVGLTEIGEVHGYIKQDEDIIPDEGVLKYRGIDIAELVNGFQNEDRMGFEEVVYLLLFAQLPNAKELEYFKKLLGESRELPANFTEDMILKAPSNNIMNKIARSVLALHSYDDNPEDDSIQNVLKQSISLIGYFPIFMAYAYQAKLHYYENKSLYIHSPLPELTTSENILRLIRPDMKYDDFEAKILDLCLVLHAEHGGGNNSAFTTHVVSSSGTDTYSAIAAAVGSLKGKLHGGANLRVMNMMENIRSNVKDWSNETEVKEYIKKILLKQVYDKSGLVYGMGHAVYTLSDPRATLLKKKAEELAGKKNRMAEFQLYSLIEKVTPELFSEIKNSTKRISANVDFYSGFVYSMLDIDPELYTPLFAVARVTGWCAHRVEEIISGGRIIRPAYKSVSIPKGYVPFSDRV